MSDTWPANCSNYLKRAWGAGVFEMHTLRGLLFFHFVVSWAWAEPYTHPQVIQLAERIEQSLRSSTELRITEIDEAYRQLQRGPADNRVPPNELLDMKYMVSHWRERTLGKIMAGPFHFWRA